MLTRRLLLSTALAFAALAARAEHADLEPPPEADAVAAAEDMPRRWLMEDAWGNVHTDDEYLGKFVLIYFGYTGCPDVCPTSLSTIADVLAALGPDAEKVVALFVTVDPDHDTAKLLQQYTEAFDPRIVPLRGPLAYTDHMVKAFNARYEKYIPDPAHPERYSIDHTASIALVGPRDLLETRYPHGMSAEDIAADLRKRIVAMPPQ